MNVNDYDFSTFPEEFKFLKSRESLKSLMEPQLEEYHPIGRNKIIEATLKIASSYFFEMLVVQSTFEIVEKSEKDIDLTLLKLAGGPSQQIIVLEMGYPELFEIMRENALQTICDNEEHYDNELNRFILQFYPKIGDKIIQAYKESEEGVLNQDLYRLEKLLEQT